MEAGANGLVFGRNVWQGAHTASLDLVHQLRTILDEYPG
jgi:class I fructose-bisphosphate aldolase